MRPLVFRAAAAAATVPSTNRLSRMASSSPTHGGKPRRRAQNDGPEVRLSKRLAYLLRHGAAKEGLSLRSDGSIAVGELTKHPKLRNTTFDQIKHIVDTNDKKRFVMFEEPGPGAQPTWYIRASQGHTLEVRELPLVRITPANAPACIVHGTTRDKLPAIQRAGLSRMARNHIHFATGLAGDKGVISGMRATANAFIYIDIPKAMAAGIEFYRSENGVVLSEGLGGTGSIPPEYFDRIDSV
ncbi:tRNA 2'-phosphotransferase [Coemansia nantahalensis]|uniref:tRNA 2'-phosphotransferase n=1 Tax=Coemansia nantahalensis TaxID=2789366 RepID=A0ACC1K6T0_9FUNG|nr:tRNA 2'-phosphotransferase [Coemansia nantahalensis]